MRTAQHPEDIIDDTAALLADVACGALSVDAFAWVALRMCAPGVIDLSADIVTVARAQARRQLAESGALDLLGLICALRALPEAEAHLRDQLSGL